MRITIEVLEVAEINLGQAHSDCLLSSLQQRTSMPTAAIVTDSHTDHREQEVSAVRGTSSRAALHVSLIAFT